MKKNIFIAILLTSFVATLIASCASKPTKKSSEPGKSTEVASKEAPVVIAPSAEAKQLANEQETTLVTEFEFKKGTDTLTTHSKKQIEELSKQALKKGNIEVIKLISWADQEYPSPKKKNLPSDQIALAKNRNIEIKNYLRKTFPNKDISGNIEMISMAERPSFYNKLISSDDARIKRSLETAGIPNTDSARKTNTKTSRTIMLILLKQ